MCTCNNLNTVTYIELETSPAARSSQQREPRSIPRPDRIFPLPFTVSYTPTATVTMTADIAHTREEDSRPVVFFDIDNTLYSASSNISHEMGKRIHAYFLTLGMPDDEASELHHKYYKEYGLALRGLVRHHNVGS